MNAATGIDFEQDGVRYNARPMNLTTRDGFPIFFVQPYGKRGALLSKHRPAIRNAAGEFALTGKWMSTNF